MFDILNNVNYEIINKGKEFEINEIHYDSRKIKENDVFCAMTGAVVDGHDYIEKALEKGAKLIIVENKDIKVTNKDVTYIFVKNLRKKLGIIASNFYNWPQNKIKILGITGTNGKTTSSYILDNMLEKTSRIGTIGYKILDEEIEAPNTTPESLDLIKLIAKSVEKGVEYFIMEVSSHALEIGRVDMLEFDSVIFTNLTQDHLDYHETMEKYFDAKFKLFSMLRDKNGASVNIDDSYGKRIFETNKNYKSYSIKADSDLKGKILEYTNNGMKVSMTYKEKEYEFMTKLVGDYNLYNILGCVGMLLNLGFTIDEILEKLKKVDYVPGRFELVDNGQNFRVIVDYAHTDNGLENILETVRKVTDNKVITIFGAGGDRDNAKRPKMAQAAAKYSDYLIITSDNPRTEDPEKIVKEVEAGLKEINFPKENYTIIISREEAIKYGVKMSKEKDSLLIAGKGHEDYQILGREKIHFDDREIARKYL
ncbi:MAG: UDP-N-acetylmuramoyl-L-alanyl-D-glutamate--2,6-diaminopimelate ligase [Sebaldella sp.]|nr:UDP-N-acetylmuramoyl-L-alanyl-D-glutamate--2,6-diaminopimelate ligase [Sebaldella sp.]